MDTMERDPTYIAKTVRQLRKAFRLTQENLADAAGLTTRTIEKIESGRHRPEEQTLRGIARALNLAIGVFQAPSPADEAEARRAFDRAAKKMLLVKTRPIKSLADFRREFRNTHVLAVDSSQLLDDAAIEIAAGLADLLRDLGDIWPDIYEGERVEYSRTVVETCTELSKLGFTCFMGEYRKMLKEPGKPDLVFSVTLASLQPNEGAQYERFAFVELPGRWETLAADRLSFDK